MPKSLLADRTGTGDRARLTLPPHAWLLALGAALVVATALFTVPGYLTWDSGTYHLMARALYTTGSFFIPNGYDELASPLLAVGQTIVKNGRLVSQYPEFYTIISQPFYALFGYRGLMVLNAVAFVGICLLIWRMASWFSAERDAPVAAVVVYAFATYAVEFTQSSYPHLTSTFLVCASAWLLWGAVLGKDDLPGTLPSWLRSVDGRCALAGLVFGIAVGVRLDSAFAGLALAVPLLAFRALGWRPMLACGLGAVPPMLALAWINHSKFGVLLPFSYGRGPAGGTGSVLNYAPVAAAFALGLALLVWHRIRPFRVGRREVALGLAAVAAAVALTPLGQRVMFGAFQLMVDMRMRPEIAEPGLSRSAGGAVIYWGSVKKSVLESCPYLILILLPALRGLATRAYGARWLLWLVPAGFVGFYGYFAWHGSVGWNMRYLNPTLPFLAILASQELVRLRPQIPARRTAFRVGVATLWALLVAAFLFTVGKVDRQEALILNGGLILAALLLALQAMELAAAPRNAERLKKALAGVFVFSLVWSSALTVGYDYPLGATVRSYLLGAARAIEPKIAPHALVVTFRPDLTWGLLGGGKQPIIADYKRGSPTDAVALVERAIDSRPVYWLSPPADSDSLSPIVFEALRARNIEPVLEASADRDYRLFVLRKTTGG